MSSNAAKQFFNPECLKNLSNVQSKCEKKARDAIVKKYESKYQGKEMPFEVGKAILKEVNANNDQNQL